MLQVCFRQPFIGALIIANKTYQEFQLLLTTNVLMLKNLSDLILVKTINHHRIR